VGIFEILSAQSDCPLREILYRLGKGFSFLIFFPFPVSLDLFAVRLIACKILPLIETIVSLKLLF